MLTVGEFIERKRSKKDISLTELGKLCNMSQSTLSRIKNNLRDIEFNELQELSKHLIFDIEEFERETGLKILGITKNNDTISPQDEEGFLAFQKEGNERFEKEMSDIKKEIKETMKEIAEETARKTVEKTLESEIAMKHFRKHFAGYKDTLVDDIVDLHTMDDEIRRKKKEDLPPLENSIPVKITNKTIKYPILSDKSACGFSLIPAEDEIEDWIELPEAYAVNAEIVLRAKGSCLDNEEIHDSYLVFIKCQNTASSGDIVAVRVIENSHGHAILKKLKIIKDNMFLTDKTGDIIEFKENMSIVGKAIYWMPDPRKFTL